jgi:hypothetical protein
MWVRLMAHGPYGKPGDELEVDEDVGNRMICGSEAMCLRRGPAAAKPGIVRSAKPRKSRRIRDGDVDQGDDSPGD